MLTINNQTTGIPSLLLNGKNPDGVDKGTNRQTPGNSEGAKPPKKKDYRKIEQEDADEKEPQEETVDNEEKDKNKY